MSTVESDLFTGATTNGNAVIKGNGTGKVALGDGSLLVPDADGTADQVLKTDGAGNLGFATAAGGAWELVSTVTPSGVASVTDTNIDVGTNDVWALVVSGLTPVSDGVVLYMRLGDSGGVDSGATDYTYHCQFTSSDSNTYAASFSAGAAQMIVANQVGSGAGEGVDATFFISKGADGYPTVHGTYVAGFYTGGTMMGQTGARRMAAITLDRYELLFSGGNISSGTLRLYKLANA